MSAPYAAYGSNLHPLRLAARVSTARLLGTSQLAAHELKFHKRGTDGSGKGSIVAGGGGVYVAVYAMTPDGYAALDGIEGVGTGYRRTRIEVPEFGECFTYVAEPTHIDDTLQPYDWYREMVLLGCRLHGFPATYLARIEAAVPRDDPDPARRAANRALLERLRGGGAHLATGRTGL